MKLKLCRAATPCDVHQGWMWGLPHHKRGDWGLLSVSTGRYTWKSCDIIIFYFIYIYSLVSQIQVQDSIRREWSVWLLRGDSKKPSWSLCIYVIICLFLALWSLLPQSYVHLEVRTINVASLRGGSLLGKEFEQKQGSSTLQVQLKILLLWKNTQTEKKKQQR